MINMMGCIIDFKVKGNTVIFYLGKEIEDWGWTNKDYCKNSLGVAPSWLKPSDNYYGENWDKKPYEHKAGAVHDEFIYGTRTYYYDHNWIVVEACSGETNSSYCKNDFKTREVPCVIVIKGELAKKHASEHSFSFWWDFVNNTKEDYDPQDIECFRFEDILVNGETLETDKTIVTF